ncbi:hypothetical protein [Nonomuraea sp. LPB2021202275-12-8]|uniref:hypothetical protein n=1 Tax=Nonomuraea sp. LPB2021202275-12-8 TaxID=3120159 RepID=UPI00300D5FE0
MTPSEDGADSAPLDLEDILLLDEINRLYSQVDPVPADLVANIRFALAVDSDAFDVFRVFEEEEQLAGVRGGERSRTITFDSDNLTIMIDVTPLDGGAIRIDGWLAPPAGHRVELRTAAASSTARADDQGRFAFDGVSQGLAQFVVRGADDAALAVTPSIDL